MGMVMNAGIEGVSQKVFFNRFHALYLHTPGAQKPLFFRFLINLFALNDIQAYSMHAQ